MKKTGYTLPLNPQEVAWYLLFAPNIHLPFLSHLFTFRFMAHTGKTIATLLTGVAVGAAVGYLLATDPEERTEELTRLRDFVNDKYYDLKSRFSKESADLEEEIYNA